MYTCVKRFLMKYNSYYFLGVVLIAVFFFAAMNMVVPFYNDDMLAEYHIGTGEYVRDGKTALDSVICSWHTYIGRIIPALLMPLIVNVLGDGMFNLLNVIVYLVVICQLYFICDVRGDIYKMLMVLIGLFLINTRDLFFWASGGVNYLWATCAVMAFLILSQKVRSKDSISLLLISVLSVVSFLLSLFHEMLDVAVISGLWIEWFCTRKKERKNWHYLVLLVSFSIGTAVVTLCPALFFRASTSFTYLGGMMIVHRIAHLFTSLYVTWLLFFLIVYLLVNGKMRDVFKAHRLYFLFLFFSFIPWLVSGEGGRALYATELFSVILLLRLIDVKKRRMQIGVVAIWLLMIVAQCIILKDSIIKWDIYREVVDRYMKNHSNVVLADYFEGCTLLSLYETKQEELYRCVQTIRGLKWDKERVWNKKVRPLRVIQREIWETAIVDNAYFFSEKNRVLYSNWYDSPLFIDYVAKYNRNLSNQIGKGLFYAVYSVPLIPSIKLKVNYTREEVESAHPFRVVSDRRYGKYILLSKKYKNFPMTELDYFGINSDMPSSKFELLK